MKKLLSLTKACMTENMSLFRVKTKGKKANNRLPIILFLIIFFYMWGYANMMMEPLNQVHLEHTVLVLFIAFTTIMTLVEGIYKSSNLLFNCKDDDMLLSLPIQRSTVLFIRVFKFYVFELMYNSMFLVPAMVAYVRYVDVGVTYYISSIIAILLLPIIPIIISCIFGGFIAGTSAKFKHKNIAQIVITMLVLVVVFYGSFNLQNFVDDIGNRITGINDTILKVYYPAKLYSRLVTDFNILDLVIFISIHIAPFVITIFALSKIYFTINSRTKEVKHSNSNGEYKIKTNKPIKSLIKKELNRFINSPVFVTNAAFGLVLFLLGCIFVSIKFEEIAASIAIEDTALTVDAIRSYMPVILFGFVCFSSLLSSITSSMISLEGKSFSILKSLPVKPFTIILSKVLTAIILMIPLLIIGDIVVFVRFGFNILEVLMILAASIVLPFVAETFGILVNLKYPRMDADNDTEVVKQSMSTMVAVLGGTIMSMITIGALAGVCSAGVSVDMAILGGLIIYTLIAVILIIHLLRKGAKKFNNIQV